MNLDNLSFSRYLTRITSMVIAMAINLDSLFFSRRVRQNHALEHATTTILSGMIPDLNISGRSSPDGFVIFGDVDLGLFRRATDEALRRLQAGEAELAIHPNCDINIIVGMVLITLGALFSLASNGKRTRIVAAAVSCTAGLMAARSVGEFIQRYFTTLSDLTDVRVTEIARRKFFGFTFIEVRTAGKVHSEHDAM